SGDRRVSRTSWCGRTWRPPEWDTMIVREQSAISTANMEKTPLDVALCEGHRRDRWSINKRLTSKTAALLSKTGLSPAQGGDRLNVNFAEQPRGGLVELIGAAELFEFLQQIVGTKPLLGGARRVENQTALVDHHQPVSERGGVRHRVGD